VSLNNLFERYHDRVAFLIIYIREAHPVDGWWLGKGLPKLWFKLRKSRAATDVYDPQTLDERRAVAGRCETMLEYGIRTYVDDVDDAVNKAYAAMPTRLYLVGLDGRVAYAGGLGPFGFKPAELGAAIDAYLSQTQNRNYQQT
jgi:hypothetical protein